MKKKDKTILAVVTSVAAAAITGAAIYFGMRPEEEENLDESTKYFGGTTNATPKEKEPGIGQVLSTSVRTAGDTCSKVAIMMNSVGAVIDTAGALFGSQQSNNSPRTDVYDPRGCQYANQVGYAVTGAPVAPIGNAYWNNNAYCPTGYTYYPSGAYSCNSGNGGVYFTGNPIAR